jgi:membrane protein YdbS with pleckstrin-like domain
VPPDEEPVSDDPSDDVAPEIEGEPEAAPEARPAAPFDGAEHSVDPASIALHRIIVMVPVMGAGAAVLLVLVLLGVFSRMPAALSVALPVAWGLVVSAVAYLSWRWPAWHHQYLRYRVDRRGLRIQRGVLWRKVVSIPTTRVQHTDVTQGPLQRNYGLATLVLHTAGTKDASITLSGLSHEVALRLRDHLLPHDGV